ncbi:hypothetical protein STEG23_028949 [Scotinomys teguina]
MASSVLSMIKEEVTCPICLELLKEPVNADCDHIFCRACITLNYESSKGKEGEGICPVCRVSYLLGNLRPNRHVTNIVERLTGFKSSPEEEQKVNVCAQHGEKLQLFCEKDRVAICWLCERSQEHRGHQTVLIEEVAHEYKFIYMVYYIDRLSYVEPSLHLWDKAYLIVVNNVFDVFLESVCQYFIEYFCINVHEGDCSYISNFISDFINFDALSLPFEKVPWGAEKKQKDGSCFLIHSVNLCLFIGELRPLILRDINDQICWNPPSSAFCKAGFVDRLGLFMVSQISCTFCVMTFLNLVFSLTDVSILSINQIQSDVDKVQMEFKGLREFLDAKEKNELQKLNQHREDILNSLVEFKNEVEMQRESVRDLISDVQHHLQCSTMEMLQGVNSVLTRNQTLRLKQPDMVSRKQRKIFRAPDLNGMLKVFQVHMTLRQVQNKNVVINEDKRQVQHRNGCRRNLRISETYDLGVLGYPAFHSGKHYWEVDVYRKDAWLLGLNDGKCAQPQLHAPNENGIKVRYNSDSKQHVNYQPKYGYWVIGMKNGSVYNAFEECSVTHNASVLVLSLTHRPSRVGVFLDREACTLSFYDVSNHGVLIYRFYEPSFPKAVYAYFNPMESSELMTVCGPPA